MVDFIATFVDRFGSYPNTPDNFLPRFNQLLGGIVCYAEGEGYLKFYLKLRGEIDRYYNASTNYATVLPEPDHVPPSFLQRFMRKARGLLPDYKPGL